MTPSTLAANARRKDVKVNVKKLRRGRGERLGCRQCELARSCRQRIRRRLTDTIQRAPTTTNEMRPRALCVDTSACRNETRWARTRATPASDDKRWRMEEEKRKEEKRKTWTEEGNAGELPSPFRFLPPLTNFLLDPCAAKISAKSYVSIFFRSFVFFSDFFRCSNTALPSTLAYADALAVTASSYSLPQAREALTHAQTRRLNFLDGGFKCPAAPAPSSTAAAAATSSTNRLFCSVDVCANKMHGQMTAHHLGTRAHGLIGGGGRLDCPSKKVRTFFATFFCLVLNSHLIASLFRYRNHPRDHAESMGGSAAFHLLGDTLARYVSDFLHSFLR